MKHIIFFHTDHDGQLAGALMRYKLEEIDHVTDPVIMWSINYGDEFPWDIIGSSDHVYMLDFSLQPLDQMPKLRDSCRQLVWIDHHPTSLDLADQSISGKRALGKAACRMIWESYFDNPHVPSFVRLVDCYDRWDHAGSDAWDDAVMPFHYGLDGLNTHPDGDGYDELWRPMIFFAVENVKDELDNWVSEIMDAGQAIKAYADKRNAEFVDEHAYETAWEGRKWLVVNGGSINTIPYDEGRFAGVVSFTRVRGEFWRISMRTKSDDLDLSQLAKEKGGGGHKQAAGFETKTLPVDLLNAMT